MKKPHKSKPRKAAKPARALGGAQPAALVTHSTRRSSAQRPDPRHAHAARHPAPATIYRRPNPLLIETRDDRQAFRLLLLPLVGIALLLAVIPSLHVFPTLRDLIAQTPLVTLSPVTDIAELRVQPPQLVADNGEASDLPAQPSIVALGEPVLDLPIATLPRNMPDVATVLGPDGGSVIAKTAPPVFDAQHQPKTAVLDWAVPPSVLPERTPERQQLAAALPAFAAAKVVAPAPGHVFDVSPPAIHARQETVAMLAPPGLPGLLQALPPAPYETTCPVSYGSAAAPASEPTDSLLSTASFGERLAGAALEQTKNFVIYDDKYRQIARTGGDVPALYGVCTDVVIRAYRALGIDLQALVQASRLGAGDPNIDHRRTETLRRFLARYGQALAVTPYGEDYQPGDIVTYWRPQNSGSRSHIALVAGKLGPSGRPMIIHNRGWGPQMEDGLFVDRITGHYRYDGASRPPLPPQLATTPARPFPVTTPATAINLRTTGSLPAVKPNGL